MNILFASHGDFTCMGSIRVFGFANQLARMGHACAVAVPGNKESVGILGAPRFSVLSFDEVNAGARLFGSGAAPDLLHCWTPRENVRRFAEPLRKKWGCKLALHLDENDARVIEVHFGMPFEKVSALSAEELSKQLPADLPHPLHFKAFIESADGVTVVMDRLKEFLPYSKPVEVLWPGVDGELFNPRPNQNRAELFAGIEPGDHVLVFCGDASESNRAELRSLYLALGDLNARGVPTKLLRAGVDLVPFLSPHEEWVRRFEIKLGRVDWNALPAIVNAADVFVQPGRDDACSAYRFPPLLPEFLALGKPVVLPRTNLGRFLADGDHAILLQTGCAREIAACVEALFKGPELRAHLGAAGQRFAKRYLTWDLAGTWMERFYQRVCPGCFPESIATAGERNPLIALADHPVSEPPENQAAYEQLMILGAARWPAIAEALRAAEDRVAHLSAEAEAARADFNARLAEARKTKSWRFMQFLRRSQAMLWHRTHGGIGAYFRWLFKRPGAPKECFDPFEEAKILTSDFDPSAKKGDVGT